ncbi:MAG: type II toxin-antitoxin system VapC family toxin [bacterium]|nr:type II toxin-antitoxin system VapC family toxin [bacterium]
MILLDTNVLLRMTAADPKIGERSRHLIDEAVLDDGVGVSAFVFLEAARLHWDEKVNLGMPPEVWRKAHLRRGLLEIPLTGDIAIQAAGLYARQGFHRDPGDQLIVATAISSRSTLATTDHNILQWAAETNVVAVLDATE